MEAASGFEFRFRLNGGPPTVRTFPVRAADAVSRGDLLMVDGGAGGAAGLVGVVVDTLSDPAHSPHVRAVTDADAVYAVADSNARVAGAALDLAGATGAQGVTSGGESALTVLLDSAADEATLVRIAAGRHRPVGDDEGRDLPLGAPLNTALANAVAGLYRRHIGRGPAAVEAFHTGATIVVMLAGALTPAERTLADSGRHRPVLSVRAALHDTMSADLIAAVEALTGRRVAASMAANHIAPDVSAELFVVDRPLPSVVAA